MYRVPTAPARIEAIVKKSRFIASAAHVVDRPAAMKVLEQVAIEYPDARHHCWAYLLGAPDAAISAAMSDDGEPSGTAGKPILNVLRHKGVGDVMVVVTRYFGGIRLGAAGLVRAYSSATQQVMDVLKTHKFVAMKRCTVSVSFDQEQVLRHWLVGKGGKILQADYASGVSYAIELPSDTYVALVDRAARSGWFVEES